MSNYSRGSNFERRVKRYYKSQGYLVWRSAGSHSPADLICIRLGEVILVQCKLNGRMSLIEKEQLIELARENRCQAVLAYRQGKKLVIRELLCRVEGKDGCRKGTDTSSGSLNVIDTSVL